MSLIPPTDDDYEDDDGVAWRNPVGFDAYLVSFLGHVKSFNDGRYPDGRLIRPPSGRTLVINDNGLRTTKSVAQLVMLAWHSPSSQPGMTVGHLNNNRSDNRAVNLFWESRSQQNLRAARAPRDRCPRGHVYSGPNLFFNRHGARCCRACYRAHWWASKLRREAAALPSGGRPHAPVTIDVVLSFSADGRFPSGPPPLSEVLIQAARIQHQIDRDASRLVG